MQETQGKCSYWGDDPEHPVEDWQADVAANNTRMGYWDWALLQRTLNYGKEDRDA